MKAQLSHQQKMQKQSLTSGQGRLPTRGEEVKRDLFQSNNSNHLQGRDFGYINHTSQQLDDSRQKRIFPQQTYTQNVHHKSQGPPTAYQSKSEFSKQLNSQKEEPFLARVQRSSGFNNYSQHGSSVEDKSDYRRDNLMSSTEQLFYKPSLEQSPQIVLIPQSPSRRDLTSTQSRIVPLSQPESLQSLHHPISQHISLSNQQDRMSNSELDQVILNLHSKMKSLENKYIDLANYYKKELVSRKDISDLQIEAQDQHQRFRASGSSFYSRPKSPYQKSEVDPNIESVIISELLQEKNDLEQELQNIINVQCKLQEDDQALQEKLRYVERENLDLKEELFNNCTGRTSLKSDTRMNQMEQVENLKQQVTLLLDKFQQDFLNFINSNYQSFTENDVTGMFGVLKQDINIKIETTLLNLGSSRLSSQIEIFDAQKKELIAQYKKEMEEYELNQEYTLQNIQRCAFEFQNKHSTAGLDMKKLGLALNSLTKATQQLSGSSNQPSYHRLSQQSYTNKQQEMKSISGFKKSVDGMPISPSSPRNPQQLLIGEIQGQVQLLNQTFNEMSQKQKYSDKDLSILQQIEKECSKNLTQFRSAFSQFMIQMDIGKDTSRIQHKKFRFDQYKKQSADTVIQSQDDQSHNIYSRNMNELKAFNDKLQRELDAQIEKFNNVKQENIRLHSELDIQQLQAKSSPLRKTYLSIYDSEISGKKRHSSIQPPGYRQSTDNLESQMSLLQNENEAQKRQIRTLKRQIDDKTYEIEKLYSDNHSLKQQQPPSNSTVDEVAFLKSLIDDKNEQFKILMKQALKFIYAMKKLQKAVHNKEQNVQKEKADFEITRKELERNLKALKKEFDKEDQNKSNAELQQVRSSFNYYQNKAPTIKGLRITEKTKTPMQRISSSYQQEGCNSFSDHRTLYQDKSPMAGKHLFQGDPHRSVGDIDRRQSAFGQGRSLISSMDKLNYTSTNTLNSYQISNLHTLEGNQPNAINRLAILHDDHDEYPQIVQNIRQELDMIKKELRDEQYEKDRLQKESQIQARDKEQLLTDNNELGMQLDRERRRNESVKREISSLEHEKETLIQQLHRVQNFNPLRHKETDEVHLRNRKLEEEVLMVEKMNVEYKKTISILEENAELAKRSIIELKETLNYKEMKLQMLNNEKNMKEIDTGSKKVVSEAEFRKLKSTLLEQINSNSKYYDDQLDRLEQKLQEKENELELLAIKLERKLKEKDTQSESTNQKSLKEKCESLKQVIKELEQKTDNDQLQLQIKQLQQSHKQELEQVKDKVLGVSEAKIKQEVASLNANYNKQIEQLEKEYNLKLKEAEEQTKIALQNQKRQLTLKSNEETNQQLATATQSLEAEYSSKLSNLESEKEQLKRQMREYVLEIEKLKQSLNKQQDMSAQIKDFKVQVKKEQDKQAQEYQDKVAILKKQQVEQESQYKNYIQQLQEQLESFNTNQKEQLAQQEAQFNKQIEQLQIQHRQDLQDREQQLNQAYTQLKQTKQNLQKQEQQFEESKQEYTNLIDELNSQLLEKEQQMQTMEKELKQKMKKNFQKEQAQLASTIQSSKQDLSESEKQIENLKVEINKLKNQVEQSESKYKIDLEESTSNLKKNKEKIGQLERNLAESAKQYNDKILEKEDEADMAKQELQQTIFTIQQLNSDFEKQKAQLENQTKDQFNSQKAQYEQKIQDSESKHKQELKNLEFKYNEQMSSLEQQFNYKQNDLQSQIDNKAKEISHISKQKEESEQENQALSQQISNLMEEMGELQNQINEKHSNESSQMQSMQSQVGLLHSQIHQKDEQIASLKQALKDKATEVEKIESTVNRKDAEIKSLKNDIHTQQSKVQKLETIVNEQTEQISEISNQLSHKDDLLHQKASDHDTIVQAKSQLEKTLHDKEKEIIELQSLNKSLTDSLTNSNQQIKQLKSQSDKLNETQTQQSQELQVQNQALESQLTQKTQELHSLQKQLHDLESQTNLGKTLSDSFQQKIQKLEAEMAEKEQQLSSNEQNLQHELKKKEDTMKKKNKEIEGLQEMCRDLEEQLVQKEQEVEKTINELTQRNKQLEGEKQALMIEAERRIYEIIEEKENLYEELQQMISQGQNEKESVEVHLKDQLQHAKAAKLGLEKELLHKDQEIESLKDTIDAKDKQIQEYKQKIVEVKGQLKEHQQEGDETMEKLQQTLDDNKDLIQTLKDQLQNTLNKQVQQEKELQTTHANLLNENTGLKAEIQNMKTQFNSKFNELTSQIQSIQEENRQKTKQIEKGGKVIEEFNAENQVIKDKLKHLMQICDSLQEESKEREIEQIDLEGCFEKIETILYKNKVRQEAKIAQLESDKILLQKEVNGYKDELMQMQANFGQIQCELMNALNRQELNDIDMRKQMETAQKKIQSYKEKLMEKQKYINQLETEKKKEGQQMNESFSKETNDLLMKLQKAEKELQNYRSAQSTNPRGGLSQTMSDQSAKFDNEKVQQLEEQLQAMKKQLFQAKDQVIDNLSETFAKKIKDLQQMYINENILKNKLKEPDTLQLNTMVEECRRVPVSTDRFILIIKMKDQYVAVEENKLSQTVQTYLRSYIPSGEHDKIEFDEKQLQVIQTLEDQIKELREERLEMLQELSLYKQRFTSPQGKLDIQDLKLVDLEEEVGHLNAENLELRGKMKELSLQNSKLKVRILQQNEMIKDMTKSKDDEASQSKLLKLIEENEELKNQLKQKAVEEKLGHEGSFLVELKGHDVFGEECDQNLFDQSSLNDVMEHFGKDITPSNKDQLKSKVSKLELQVEELSKINKNLNQEIQKSKDALTSEEASVIGHIKGTLVQFLKNCPMTEKNNEELLAIVFSMMEFSKDEIQEIQNYRQKTRSVSSSGYTDPDEETKKKPKRGIMSIFGGKKDKDLSLNRQTKSGQSNIMSPSPKPIQRY